MELSMTLPTMVPHGRSELLAWCRAIDEGPYASLAAGVDEVFLVPTTADPAELDRTREALGR